MRISQLLISLPLILVSLLFNPVKAQENKPLPKKRGTFYISWGYNRESYSRSDIRFKNTTTDNYDFTLVNAEAHDKPGFNDGVENFVSRDLTIPQYNLHLGYFFNDKHNLGIEVSWDHLKYVVYDNRDIHVRGNIHGHQIDKDTFVSSTFVHLQHTNGNNYLMVSITKKQHLYSNRFMNISLMGKAGGGPLVSYSISTIMGDSLDAGFRLQGFVLGATLGLRIDLFKYLFIQPAFQGAYANYTNTEIGSDRVGRATHQFGSYTLMLEGGFNIPLDLFYNEN